MRRIFKMFLSLALVLAMLVPFSVIGASAVKAEGDNVYINVDNFPDENFRNYLLSNTDWYTSDGTGKYFTPTQISKITRIDCSEKNISTLEGIKFFTALQTLHCYDNNLTSLDVTKNTELVELWCDHNELTSLDVTKNTELVYLWCHNNELTSLDVTKNTELVRLYCNNNELTSLDVTKNTELLGLYCENNQLTSLDLAANNNLSDADLSIDSQTPVIDLIIKDKKFYVDMNAVTGDVSRVTITDANWILDTTTGIATYTGTDFPKEISYTYATNHGDREMEVTASFGAGKYAPTSADYKYVKESGKPLTITFKRATDDSETYWMFTGLKLDGKDLDEKYYKLSKGSLNVELSAELLDTLEAGSHTLTVSFVDGGEVTASFAVASKETNNIDTSTSENASSTATPQTGDSSNIVIYLVLSALAVAGAAMVVASYRLKED